MSDKKNNDLLKNGVWIKEQNGVLTMGSLDDDDHAVVLSREFSDNLFKMEDEMMSALYGPAAEKFYSENINIKRLIEKAVSDIDDKDIKISVHCDDKTSISVSYDDIYDVISGLLNNSIKSADSEKNVYINASVADNTLCLIYRDSGQCGKPEAVKVETEIIQNRLKGKVKINETDQWTYLDITIPESS
eukprot:gnl/Chilomastix_cuspidata/9481.p1 GENE.gnl/Chilomastix_cuspidata/9481~~gnl/Chilomastix_cuspidata/9481.p1  ORF type:complete len:198 (+),score=19.15 gnl/Chilomastix_cuspidata/9481:28-594(+)